MQTVFGDLTLNDISDPLGGGSFYFEKGTSKSYHYKNLSGGEKAAFDILLDIHLKKKYYSDAIWCIDEVETHLHTRVQGTLIGEVFSLVPSASQLWLTTHSLGVMRAAHALSIEHPGSVSIIDFDGVDSDAPSRLMPSSLGRIAWEKVLSIALDDLTPQIMPAVVVVCEGSTTGSRRKNFDAEIYNRVLGSHAMDVVFISGGSSNQVATIATGVRTALGNISSRSQIVALCDRDDKSEREIADFQAAGGIVLSERNLESYLFADDVLTELAITNGHVELVSSVLAIKEAALLASISRGNNKDDLKSAAGEIFVNVVRKLGLTGAGSDTDAFMRDTLAPLITANLATFALLKRDVLDRLAGTPQ